MTQDAYSSLAGICTSAQWFQLPMELRKRWWKETNYGTVKPSDELVAAIKAAIN